MSGEPLTAPDEELREAEDARREEVELNRREFSKKMKPATPWKPSKK